MLIRVSDPFYTLDLAVHLRGSGFIAEAEDEGIVRVQGPEATRLRSALMEWESFHPDVRAEVQS